MGIRESRSIFCFKSDLLELALDITSSLVDDRALFLCGPILYFLMGGYGISFC